MIDRRSYVDTEKHCIAPNNPLSLAGHTYLRAHVGGARKEGGSGKNTYGVNGQVLCSLVPRPRPSTRERGSGDFSRFSWHFVRFTHAYAHAHFSNKRVIRELRIVSCPGGGVLVAVTREFERDNCVTSEILQSDWTIPNRAGVPRKSTKVPRPSFVRESREGLGVRGMQLTLTSQRSHEVSFGCMRERERGRGWLVLACVYTFM